MKNIVHILVGLIIFCSQTALADDLSDFGHQMSHFYLAPSQEAFESFQKNANEFQQKLDATKNGASVLVAVMIVRISQQYHWSIGNGIFGARAKELTRGQSELAKFVFDDLQVNPMKLDIWWASFFATGDEEYLEKIFSYAGLELPKNNLPLMLTIGAAKWSFKSNCRQHKKILEFVRQKLESPTLSEMQIKFLKECIAYGEQNTIQ